MTNETLICLEKTVGSQSGDEHILGSEQVILVRDETSKKEMDEYFPNALVMTILESKGLEFKDVILVNFFKDSPYKNWRSLDHVCHESDKKRFMFDINKEFLLSTELKTLYVAITRTIENLIIFDQDQEGINHLTSYLARKNVPVDKSFLTLI